MILVVLRGWRGTEMEIDLRNGPSFRRERLVFSSFWEYGGFKTRHVRVKNASTQFCTPIRVVIECAK